MVEIRQRFRSLDEWQNWRPETGSIDSLRADILEDVRARGFTEPLTGLRRHPYEIVIREQDLHETLSSSGLNSRKRALLVQLELELRSRQLFSPGQLRLLGTDARPRLGLILRGLFPLHLAAEVDPAAEDPRRMITVPLAAPDGLDIADASFDVFVIGECFKDIGQFRRALPEIIRILRPGGLIVGYLPFVTAAGPASSSGWDVLDLLRQAGCPDAYMTAVASSYFGIASEGKPGPFILTAQKQGADQPQSTLPPEVVELGPLPDKLCVMLALPRSGTTLLTSMFAVHSQFVASYEPWNSKLMDAGPDGDVRIATLLARDRIDDVGGKTLFVKETAVDSGYIRGVRRLFEQAPFPVQRHSIFLLRDLDHTVLSEVDRRNEWWNDNVTLNQDFIATWARNRGASLWQIIAFAVSANSLVVAFEELAARPEKLMRELADRMDFHFEREQIEYEKHMQSQKVRGDLNVSRSPAKIDLAVAMARRDRVEALERMIEASAAAPWFAACRALHAYVTAGGGIVPMAQIPKDIVEALRPR